MTRRTRQLRAWMMRNDLDAKAIASATGVSPSAVYRYIKGRMASAHLRAWFLSLGCPAVHLPAARKTATSNIGKAA